MGLVDVRITVIIIIMVHQREVQIHYIQTGKPTRSCRGVPPPPKSIGFRFLSSYHYVSRPSSRTRWPLWTRSTILRRQATTLHRFYLMTSRFLLCPSITHATSVKVTDSIALFLLVEMPMERFERHRSLILASPWNSNSNQLKFIASIFYIYRHHATKNNSSLASMI